MPDTFYKRNLPHWQPPGATFFITWCLYGSLPSSALDQIEATRKLLEQEAPRPGETDEERTIRHFKKLFALYDGLLDKAESGPWWLKDEKIATVVENSLLRRYAHLYTLYAYVVMPNHVHVFLRPKLIAQTEVRATDAQTGVVTDARTEVRATDAQTGVVTDARTEVRATDAQTGVATDARTEVRATTDDWQEYVPLKKITQYLKGYSAYEANKILGRTGQSFWQEESYDRWARDDDEFYRIIAYIENNPVKAGLAQLPEVWPWSSAAERKRLGYTEIRPLT